MSKKVFIAVAIVLVALGAYVVYASLGANTQATVDTSYRANCAPLLGDATLVESGVFIGDIETDVREIAPEEGGRTYLLHDVSPGGQHYYLSCYYGSDAITNKELPASLTQCDLYKAALVCN